MLHSNEIKVNLKEYEQFVEWYSHSSYAPRAIDECSKWEIREALSYFLRDTEDINQIVDSVIVGNVMAWSPLTLVDEARVQSRFRQLGYDLKCLDQWPTTAIQFVDLLENAPLIKQARFKISSAIYTGFGLIPKFKYSYIVFCLAAIFYYHDWWMLAVSLWFSHFLWGLVEFADHEYLEHRYVVPKNKLAKHLVEYFCYIWMPSTYVDKAASMRVHQYHHKYWKGEKDTFSHKALQEIIGWFKNPPWLKRPNSKVMHRLINEYSDFPYIVKYLIEIQIVLSIVFIAVFGFKYYLFFYMIPIIMRHVFQGQHDIWFLLIGERDHGWLFPLALNQSWHLTHHNNGGNVHKSWSEVFGGPKWVKYFNPQYYFGRIFFKIKYVAK